MTPLATLNTVRLLRGLSTEAVLALVESGQLRWVFNIATSGRTARELRFWPRELKEPGSVAKLAPALVVNELLGTQRTQFRGSEVADFLCASRQLIQRLHQGRQIAGRIEGHTRWITRQSLAEFLNRRLIA